MPTISFSQNGWSGTNTRTDNITRMIGFKLESDIPIPNRTYILLEDPKTDTRAFVPMGKGSVETEWVELEKICPAWSYDYSLPYLQLQIMPPNERDRHVPYHHKDFTSGGGYITLPSDYQFNPYNVGERSTFSSGSRWCE
ncbi:MAG: hypothetical protein OXT74_02580 [Candidatus Poribacteria bacterium]|nr:hypothetical protein [Candidatus Poribacteria bacterium]